MPRTSRRTAIVAAGGLAVSALAGCASDSNTAQEATTTPELCTVSVSDAWVKATDTEMTGAFGILTNTGDAEMVVESATSPVAGKMEIHEVVDQDGEMVMRPLEGGLVLAAGETATLAPGQNHLMLMALPEPIEAGQEIEITLTCSDGGTAAYSGVAKPFEGGEETYEPGMADMQSTNSSPGPQS